MNKEIVREWQKACAAAGVFPGLQVVNDTKLEWSGEFDHDNYMVRINIAGLRTLRDIIIVVAHEVRHAWQFGNLYDFNEQVKFAYSAYNVGGALAYHLTPTELDANLWALSYEDTLTYKNVVLNDTVDYNHFVDTKKMYNSVTDEEMHEHLSAMKEMLNGITSFFR